MPLQLLKPVSFWPKIGLQIVILGTASTLTAVTATRSTVPTASTYTHVDFSDVEIGRGNRPGDDDFNATDDDTEILPG